MKCRDCKHYKGDARMGVCLRQALKDPVHGVSYGLAFANEGGEGWSDCDMAEPRARVSRETEGRGR